MQLRLIGGQGERGRIADHPVEALEVGRRSGLGIGTDGIEQQGRFLGIETAVEIDTILRDEILTEAGDVGIRSDKQVGALELLQVLEHFPIERAVRVGEKVGADGALSHRDGLGEIVSHHRIHGLFPRPVGKHRVGR